MLRISFIIFLTIALNSIYGQTEIPQIRLSINSQGNTLSEVLKMVENESGYSFSYSAEINLSKPIHIRSVDKPLEEVLHIIFDQCDAEFKIMNSGIVLVRNNHMQSNKPEEQKISGYIREKETGEAIDFASVSFLNTNRGTSTNSSGYFELSSEGMSSDSKVKIQMLGYMELVIPLSSLDDGYVRIDLEKEIFEIDDILIEESPQPIGVLSGDHALQLRRKIQQSTVSGLGGSDLFRNLQFMPGIAAHNDDDASIAIRGNNSGETLVVLDGMPLYNTSHFFGFFSSINPQYVESVKLYKNVLPINYGGRTSGLVDMESSSIESDKATSVDINQLNASISTRFSVGTSSMLSVGGRSTLRDLSNTGLFNLVKENEIVTTQNFSENDLLDRMQVLDTEPTFGFYDLNAKFEHNFTDDHTMKLNFFHSDDKYQNEYDREFIGKESRGGPEFVQEDYTEKENWSTVATSVQHQLDVNDSFSWFNTLSYSKYATDGELTSDIKIKKRNQIEKFVIENGFKNQIEDINFNSYLQFPKTGGFQTTMGMEIISHNSTLEYLEEKQGVLTRTEKGYEINPYFQLSKNTNDWNYSLGLRTSYYSPTGKIYFSPRVLANYFVNDHVRLKASYGYNHQFLRELYFENRQGQRSSFWVLSDGDRISESSSQNFMTGLSIVTDRFTIDTELFYKQSLGVIEIAKEIPGINQNEVVVSSRPYRIYTGQGRSYGVDFLLGYKTGSYNSTISYTLSKSENNFKSVNRNKPFPSGLDRRHQLQWMNNYQLNHVTLSANWIYASGRPYINLSAIAGNTDRDKLDIKNIQESLPAYARMDIGLSYDLTFYDRQVSIYGSVLNIWNNNNVKYQQYIYALPSDNQLNQDRLSNAVLGNQTNLLERTLNIGIKVGL